MDVLAGFVALFSSPELIALVALGTFAGVYVGAIPGLSVTMAVSILISFTFSWDVYPAIALMIGIYMGGVYGGSRTAILLNIPARLRLLPRPWTAIPWHSAEKPGPPLVLRQSCRSSAALWVF